MERTVPSTASEEVELYLRTYYSLLRSSAEVQIQTLEEVHAGMNSLMHLGARQQAPDMGAFIYSILRLPSCISQVRLVVLGQSLDVFLRGGIGDVETWKTVSAVARRRKCYYNGVDTLACFIASQTDIDDVIPLLTSYQIEWNKFHYSLKRLPTSFDLSEIDEDDAVEQYLADTLEISWEDTQRIRAVWGKEFVNNLQRMTANPLRLRVQLLSGSVSEYRRATNNWWNNIEKTHPEIKDQPVYFISSNPHSLPNLLTGFALRNRDSLVDFLDESENAGLLNEWKRIEKGEVPSSRENFLYYVLKKYMATSRGEKLLPQQRLDENSCGILRIPSSHSFDVEAQVVELSCLNPDWFDPRVVDGDLSFLKRSDALILNIDYPLGLSAYNILSKVSESVGKVLGVYSIGKCASLNATIGDVMIPNVVHDEHSQNTYLIPNGFCAADIVPFLMYGTALDNQKVVSVLGTFLQTAHYMDVFYREGFTDIEMEAGPFLSAVYEMVRPRRHPVNEIVNFYEVPFDLGLIHYVSDIPLGKGKNLGAGSLSYYGLDSTYAATLAVIRRIFYLEGKRLGESFSR
jgi:hypothetical protein